MAAPQQTRIRPPVDEHGRRKAACIALGEQLGYEPALIYSWWAGIAQDVEHHAGWDRRLAEWYAVKMLPRVFKRGADPDGAD